MADAERGADLPDHGGFIGAPRPQAMINGGCLHPSGQSRVCQQQQRQTVWSARYGKTQFAIPFPDLGQ